MSLDLEVRHRAGDFTLSVRLSVGPGVTALFGPSGSGKTTLANVIAGLVRPDEGRVVSQGRVLMDSAAGIWLPPHRRRIGYVFQESRLFPHLTVRGNLLYGRWFNRRHDGAGTSLEEVVDLLDIGPLLQRRTAGLSGGETQRVAIGRALLAAPQLLLMDEPLSGLDAGRKAEILPFLERLRDHLKVPMVYVSHSLPEVARLATQVVVMANGTVAQAGPVAGLMAAGALAGGEAEAGTVLEAVVEERLERHALLRLATKAGPLLVPGPALEPGTALQIRVRARDLMIAVEPPSGLSALNVLPGRIVAAGPASAGRVDVRIQCGGATLLANLTSLSVERLGLSPGVAAWAIIKAVAFDGQASTGPPRR